MDEAGSIGLSFILVVLVSFVLEITVDEFKRGQCKVTPTSLDILDDRWFHSQVLLENELAQKPTKKPFITSLK